jgi:hypothetical protein
MAFPMGSAVSRIAQDFFDDSDLHLHLHVAGYDRWIRFPMATETDIRTDVYCEVQEKAKLAPPRSSSGQTQSGQAQVSQSAATQSPCAGTEASFGARTPNAWDARQNLEGLAERLFRIQEAAVLLQGTDKTERLRQFHDQIMVLRGAAFNGMITFFLCLFWWSSRIRSALRWTAPLALALTGLNALYNHWLERAPADPPYMEFTLIVLALSGGYIVLRRTPKVKTSEEEAEDPYRKRDKIRLPYLVLATFLTATAFLGWWSTQVLYDEQVFYSYVALSQNSDATALTMK